MARLPGEHPMKSWENGYNERREECPARTYISQRRNVDTVKYATQAGVDWFNNRRLLESIDDIPPADFEHAYSGELETQAVAG